MPGTAVGLFWIDVVMRPFAKIWEKDPILALIVCCMLYAVIGYIVLRSVYVADQHQCAAPILWRQ